MITIIKSFLWIMVFRQGPDALPVSAFLARACIVINVLVSALTNIILLTQEPWSVTLIRTLLILLINILLIWTVLRLRSFSHRFHQTISAFMGCDALITFATLIFLSVFGLTENSITGLLTAFLALWSIFVYGFIFHRSFEIHVGIGVISAFILIMFSYRLSELLLGLI